MIGVLFLSSFLISIANKGGNKKLQTIFPEGNVAYAFYALITGVVSTINFLIMTGFRPELNLMVIGFSVFFAVICRINYKITFSSLKHNGVFLNDAFSRVGSIIPPIIISALFLGEEQSPGTILGGVLVIFAALFPSISWNNKTRMNKAGIMCAIAILASNTLTTMATKLLVSLEGPEVILPYYLVTNIFIAITALFSFLHEVHYGGKIKDVLVFKKEHYILTLLIATTSNLGGYVSRFMLELVDVIQNTIISSSISVVVTVIVSLWFKEKLTKRHYISAVLSVLSAILPVIV